MTRKEGVELVKKARKELGLSQIAFAAKLGYSEGLISAWEYGTSMPKQEMINWLKNPTQPIPLRKNLLQGKRNEDWEKSFYEKFTNKYAKWKAKDFDGDEWKLINDEPIKPSTIVAWISPRIAKEEIKEKPTEVKTNNGLKQSLLLFISNEKQHIQGRESTQMIVSDILDEISDFVRKL